MYEAPESPRRSVYAAPGSALDTAQQHLRDMHERDERIHDIETALRRLEDERKKYVLT